jgi:hypothetical protein
MDSWAAEAGQLLAFALRPKLRPADDAEYADLVRRFAEQQDFADTTRNVAAGLGLRILAVSERAGAVVGAMDDSPFAVRVSDYARDAAGDARVGVRVMHGLAHLAIAASCFPRPADLDDPDRIARVSVETVDAYLRQLCERLDEQHADANLDAPADEPLLERAWRDFQRRPPVMVTSDGRAGMRTTQQAISRALKWLVEQGMMSAVSADGRGTYRSSERYRIQVKQLAAHETWVEMRQTLGSDEQETADV